MNDDANSVAQQYYNAMRRKAEGAEDLIGLFGQDAVYVEPFSNMGQATSHTGKDEIAAFIRAMPQNTPPDMEVRVDRIHREGQSVRAEWTCTSTAFARPMRGVDIFDVHDGKIARLETMLTDGGPHA